MEKPAPLWQPTPQLLRECSMAHFQKFVSEKTGKAFADYHSLHQFSVSEPQAFWANLWDFLGIKGERGEKIFAGKDHEFLPYAWFPEGRLNYAQNLLGEASEALAIESYTQNGLSGSITRKKLFQAVTSLAQQFQSLGIKAGDRIAGYVPNCIESYIAMLATTAIGAVWTSCSPDFGIDSVLDRFSQVTPSLLITVDGYQYKDKHFSLAEKVTSICQALPSLTGLILIPHLAPESLSADPQGQRLKPHLPNKLPLLTWANCCEHPRTAAPFVFEQFSFSHPLFILYSSGTTGKPKCIVHCAGGTLIQHLKELVLHTNLSAKDRLLYYTSCGWMMWNWAASALATGATLVVFEGAPLHPHPTALLDLVAEKGITIFGTSARFIHTLNHSGVRNQQERLKKVTCILSTGSPLAAEDFDYVYEALTPQARLCSISGGTDIISCFVLGNPMQPIYAGEIQCAGLGMAVEVWDESGQPVAQQKGELVCTRPFPSMPLHFWNDDENRRYQAAYFERFPGVWAHGDYAQRTVHDGYIIHGRSDTVLNPQGVRIGTAEIYNPVNRLPEVADSLVTALETPDGDCKVVLFIVPERENPSQTQAERTVLETLFATIVRSIRTYASPRHVPSYITFVNELPKTHSGKLMEVLVRELINGREPNNISAVSNPLCLDTFRHWQPSHAFEAMA